MNRIGSDFENKSGYGRIEIRNRHSRPRNAWDALQAGQEGREQIAIAPGSGPGGMQHFDTGLESLRNLAREMSGDTTGSVVGAMEKSH